MEPTAHAHTLAVSGLPDQAELLAFASALEVEVEVEGIALVRADGALGVFSVLSPSRDDLIEACRRVAGFDVTFDETRTHWDVLEVSATRAAAPDAGLDEAFRADPRGRSPLRSGEGARPRSRLPILGRGRMHDDIPFASLADGDEGAASRTPAAGESAFTPGPLAAPSAAVGPLAALDEAIEDVLTADVPPARSAGRPWPRPVEVHVLAPTLTTTAVERQQLVLIASPLRSFQQVNDFRAEIAALEGVLDLKVGRFFRGALQVIVEYADTVPLAARLREMGGVGSVATDAVDAGTIRVRLGS